MLKKILFAATALCALAGSAVAADMKEFRIGILGGENEADRLRNFQCLADHVKETLGVEKVSLFPAADYDGTIQGLLGGTLDYAELGASGYAKLYLANADAATPILTTVQTDGSTGYYSVMVTRRDSGVETLADMKGKSLCFADPDSTSGYLVPSVTLPDAVGMPVDKFFAKTQFAGGHEQGVLAALKGDCTAAVTWTSGVGAFKDGYTSGNLRKMVDKGILNMGDLRQLWQSPLIPNGPIVIRTSLPEEVKAKFKELMVNLPETDPKCFSAIEGGDFKGFTEVNPDFYKAIIAVRKAKIGG